MTREVAKNLHGEEVHNLYSLRIIVGCVWRRRPPDTMIAAKYIE
jgi:hypothetical protein